MAIVGGTAWNLPVRNMVYDAGSLSWIAQQQTSITVGALTVAATDVVTMNSLITVPYDYIKLTYTGVDLTKVEYYTGGVGGTKVATLTMTYTSNILQTVTRT